MAAPTEREQRMAKLNKAQQLVKVVTGIDPSAPIAVPEGFKVLVRGGNPFAAVGAVVTGTYTGPGKVRHMPAKGKRPASDVSTYTVETADGQEVELLASFQLEEFFTESAQIGDDVWIQFEGKVKGGQGGQVNRFKLALRPGPGRVVKGAKAARSKK